MKCSNIYLVCLVHESTKVIVLSKLNECRKRKHSLRNSAKRLFFAPFFLFGSDFCLQKKIIHQMLTGMTRLNQKLSTRSCSCVRLVHVLVYSWNVCLIVSVSACKAYLYNCELMKGKRWCNNRFRQVST